MPKIIFFVIAVYYAIFSIAEYVYNTWKLCYRITDEFLWLLYMVIIVHGIFLTNYLLSGFWATVLFFMVLLVIPGIKYFFLDCVCKTSDNINQ